METSKRQPVSVAEYVKAEHSPISHLSHQWELHSAVPLSPAEERMMVREPAEAVPQTLAGRLGALRVLVVPYIACADGGDQVSFSKPGGESHSALWLPSDDRSNLVLSCRELDPHDTGFEFLASVAELVHPKLRQDETAPFGALLEEELHRDVHGEIDEDAAAAKSALKGRAGRRRGREEFERYRDVAFVSTLAEYMHGLWHDVQIRVGAEHLPVRELRRRMDFMTQLFPPNEGYKVFSEDLPADDPS